jgi:replication-associated recombination protein RarA
MSKNRWVAKYAPTTLKDMLFVPRVREALGTNPIEAQSLLLYGVPGNGKTTTAKIIASAHTYRFWNISQTSSVEILRTEIFEFCNSISSDLLDFERGSNVNSRLKVVILDEVDGASTQFQLALKGFMNEYEPKGVRFILTSNNIHKVDDAIQSRCNCIAYDPTNKEEQNELLKLYFKRASSILKAENVAYEPEALGELVKQKLPAFRDILIALQNVEGELTVEKVKAAKYQSVELYEVLLSKVGAEENYKFLSQFESNTDSALEALGTPLIDYIIEHKPSYISKLPALIISYDTYLDRHKSSLNPFINLLACFFDLQKILISK